MASTKKYLKIDAIQSIKIFKREALKKYNIEFCDDPLLIFEDLYAIYKSAFPVSEQKSKDELYLLVQSDHYIITSIRDDHVLCGFCIVFSPLDENFALLEYMAISESHRQNGLGKRLLTETISRLNKVPLLIEIDSPDDPGDTQKLNAKRENFYFSLGCRMIEGFDYILGLKTSLPPPPMKMMVYYPDQDSIQTKLLRKYIESIYRRVYSQPVLHTNLEKMFAHLSPFLNLKGENDGYSV